MRDSRCSSGRPVCHHPRTQDSKVQLWRMLSKHELFEAALSESNDVCRNDLLAPRLGVVPVRRVGGQPPRAGAVRDARPSLVARCYGLRVNNTLVISVLSKPQVYGRKLPPRATSVAGAPAANMQRVAPPLSTLRRLLMADRGQRRLVKYPFGCLKPLARRRCRQGPPMRVHLRSHAARTPGPRSRSDCRRLSEGNRRVATATPFQTSNGRIRCNLVESQTRCDGVGNPRAVAPRRHARCESSSDGAFPVDPCLRRRCDAAD